jgi:hypothetical protein
MIHPVKVLVVGHDNGALNIIRPLLQSWISCEHIDPYFLSTPSVVRGFKEQIDRLKLPTWASEITENVVSSGDDIDRLLTRYLSSERWDAIVCGTSRVCLLEKRVLKAGRSLGIRSFAFCDMWWAYRERFRDGDNIYLPNCLWVIDQRMRKEVALEIPELSNVEIVGNPFFEEIIELRSRRTQQTSGELVIRFFSEPVFGKFPFANIDEFELFDLLIDAARQSRVSRKILVRNHPLDDIEQWRRWIWRHRNRNVEIDTYPLTECIANTGLAVGISSIVLIEMALCGVPTASIQLKSADPNYYCLPFDRYGIARITSSELLMSWLSADVRKEYEQKPAGCTSAVERTTLSLLTQVRGEV